MRGLLDGERVTSQAGGRYRFDDLVLLPRPIQARLPIMIGGSGSRRRCAPSPPTPTMWNAMGSVEKLRHKIEVLRGHCDAVGRDIAEIEMTAGCKPIIRDTEAEARRVGRRRWQHNRTPMSTVEDDDMFWVGTPELSPSAWSSAELASHVPRRDGRSV